MMRVTVGKWMVGVALLAGAGAALRGRVTAFDAGARGWACGGRYVAVNAGPCDLACFYRTRQGSRVEFLCPWAPPVTLARW